ncbi:MAG: hypothetical protein NT138_07045 [Planctomycetales bacterium]|nr:hypothetical protein [Planctomycetales bacterium]
MKQAIEILELDAYRSPMVNLENRRASQKGVSFIDLGDPKWNLIKVGPEKVGADRIRVQMTKQWFELLEEEHRGRLSFAIDREFPGYLLIATANDCECRGHRVSFGNDTVSVLLRADAGLVGRMFPEPPSSFFTPSDVCFQIHSTGRKVICVKWTDMYEYAESINYSMYQVAGRTDECPEQVKNTWVRLESTPLGEDHVLDGNGNSAAGKERSVSDAIRAYEEIADSNSN